MKTIGLITANYSNDNFGSLTKNRPLASLPFGGRYRLIDFVLSNMVNSGITKVGVITPYNSGSVIDHIGSGKPWSLDRKKDGLFLMPGSVYGIHSTESKFLFRDILENRAFLERSDADYVVLATGSDVYNMDYSEIVSSHEDSGMQITILYKRMPIGSDRKGYYLNIDSESTVRSIDTAPQTRSANYFMDCLVINKSFLMEFINWFSQLEYKDLIEIIRDNIDKFKVGSYEFKGYLGKINDIYDYLRVSNDITNFDIRNELFHNDRTIITKVQDDAPVLYKESGNAINSIIGAGCTVEGRIENSTIFRSTKIGKSAIVKNCVIMMYCEIGDGAVLENVICDKMVKVSAGSKIIGTADKPVVLSKGTIV